MVDGGYKRILQCLLVLCLLSSDGQAADAVCCPSAATAKAGSRPAYPIGASQQQQQQQQPTFGRPAAYGRPAEAARGLPWTSLQGQMPDGDQAGLEEYLRRAAEAGQVQHHASVKLQSVKDRCKLGVNRCTRTRFPLQAWRRAVHPPEKPRFEGPQRCS